MKHHYYLFLLLISFFSQAQDHNIGGTPVAGIIPITRTDFVVPEPTAVSEEEALPSAALKRSNPGYTGGSSAFGQTEGQLSVSLSGAATYAIPIAVPPGINGVAPSVSLSYNSQGGNGLAGYGWNISGVSGITRIPSTTYHDNAISAVNFTNSDRFALDGQRLVLKSGVYGKDGAEYQTEQFSDLKITSHGISHHGPEYGPAYFLVYYPDGSFARYGWSNVTSPMDYAISSWQNAQGIRMVYDYVFVDNAISISSIQYGGTTSAWPIHEIQFIYKKRGRPEQSFVGGGAVYRSTILSEIKVLSNGVGFRNYTLTHDVTSAGYERLIRFQEKSGDDSERYSPVTFVYEDTEASGFKNDATSSISVTNINFDNAAMVSGDFSGNGKMDFLLYPTKGTKAKSAYWVFTDVDKNNYLNIGSEHNVGAFKEILPVSWLNYANKLMPYQGWTVIKENGDTVDFSTYCAGMSNPIYFQYKKEYTFPKFVYSTEHPLSCRQPNRPPVSHAVSPSKRYINGDFNGDGLTDILVIEEAITYRMNYCDHNNNSQVGTGSEYGSAYLVNLDRRLTTNFVTRLGITTTTASSKLMVADVNGDGKADLLVFNPGSVVVYALDINNRFQVLATFYDSEIDIGKPILLGDYNGDGKIDFVIPQSIDSYNWNFYFATGTAFLKKKVGLDFRYQEGQAGSQTVWGVSGYSEGTYTCLKEVHYIPGDYNGDGKTDILFQVTYTALGRGNPGKKNGDPLLTTLRIYENRIANPNTISFTEAKNRGSQRTDVYKHAIPVFLTNEKRNHHLEYALVSKDKIIHFTNERDSREEVLLRKVVNGDQVTEAITYQPLVPEPYEQYYVPSSYTESYPNMDIERAPGLKVVSKLEKTFESVTKQQDFKYYGAVSNTQGLGFLGFRSVLQTDWYAPSESTKLYNIKQQDIGLRGATTESYTTLNKNGYFWMAPADFISKETITYRSELSANKVFKLVPTVRQVLDGIHNTNAVTTTEYDVYNNPLKSTTVVKEGTAVKQTAVTEISYSNQPTVPHYYIGRPLTKKERVTAYGDTRTAEEQYSYTTSGLVSQIKKKGHQTDFITENNEFDRFGNVTKKTISAAGIAPRISQYEYDPSGRFVVKSKDIEGLETQFEYQPATGLLTQETDPNGLTTQYFYDIWGKLTRSTDYLGKSNTIAYTKYNGEYRITKKAEDDSESVTVSDALGRTLRTGVKNAEDKWAYQSYQYDIHDRVVKESEPYFGSDPSLWTTTKYDIYGRPTESVAATGRVTKMSYAPLQVTVDDGVKTSTTVQDAIGNVVSVTDPGGTIYYSYYANGNARTTTYDQNVITQEQDGWGRKTKLTDPSAGTYTYEYNTLGELLKETTPKGTTTFVLDAVGKVTTKTIKGDFTDMAMTYTYDSGTKLLTKLESISDGETATYSYSYDKYQRLVETIEQTPFARFQKKNSYDAFGRVATEYSEATNSRDGKTVSATVKNTYKNGYHWQILDNDTNKVLWQTDATNARGQLEKATLGNGINVTNTYDVYGFVTAMKHDRTGAIPGTVMQLSTSFNPLKGTLNSRTNSLFNRKETFEYDNLNRLTRYPNRYGNQEEQQYDTKGRITQNSMGAYEYLNTAKEYQHTGITFGDYTKTEVLFNDSMEKKKGWGLSRYPGGNFFTYDNTKSHTGNSSLKLSTPSIVTVCYLLSDSYVTIDNASDTQYTFSGWVYSDASIAQLTLFMYKEGETGYYTKVESVNTTVKNAWQYITKTVTVPAAIKKLNIRLDNIGKGTVWFDDIQIHKSTTASLSQSSESYYANREGLFHASMEEQGGWSTGVISAADISYDFSKAKTGKYSLKISTPTKPENYVQSDESIAIDNSVPTQYTYSGWVYSDNPTAQIVLFMYKEGETGYYTQVSHLTTTVTNEWQYITQTVTVPSHIKRLRLRLDNIGNGNVWFDAIQISKTNTPKTDLRQLNIRYNAFKSPVDIEETGIDKISFKYNAFGQRSSRFYGGLDVDPLQRAQRKHYSDDGSIEIKDNIVTGSTEFVIFIGGDGYSAPVMLKSDGTKNDYYYLHRDYQGSILAISDQEGAVVEKRHFDAWGNAVGDLKFLDRGYTGHEHLQSVGIVHMNGRLYDPKVHRFLQPDNFVQDPSNTQNFNRYGYGYNNPLLYSDPSGEILIETMGVSLGIKIGGTIAIAGGSYMADRWNDPGFANWRTKNLNLKNWGKSIKKLFGGGKKGSSQEVQQPQVYTTNYLGPMPANIGLNTMMASNGNGGGNGTIQSIVPNYQIAVPTSELSTFENVLNFLDGGRVVSHNGFRLNVDKNGFATGQAAVGGLGALDLVGGGAKMGMKAVAKGGQIAEYTFTKSAGKHLAEVVTRGVNKGQLARPYMNSPLIIKEIMSTGKGTLDATFKGGKNWKIPGTFRGSQGIWELGINPKTNVIYHFNFVR